MGRKLRTVEPDANPVCPLQKKQQVRGIKTSDLLSYLTQMYNGDVQRQDSAGCNLVGRAVLGKMVPVPIFPSERVQYVRTVSVPIHKKEPQ